MTVRVRFAPSPTGLLHLGGLRTAIYNYLYAKQNNGKFIVRIEDTDRNRLVEGAVENLIKTLNWVGIEYDEGPDKDGAFGPYYQSKRLNIYQKYIQKLLDNQKAYPCFYSKERLQKIKQDKIPSNILTQQDKKYRHIPLEEALIRMKNEDYVIRLKTPLEGNIDYQDIVRGKLKFDLSLIEDQILIKSDGYPTYHFANVVDDHLMQISHVIRGEEWIASMPKHLLLYKYFGWEIPSFIHLPLILNKDKTKLSKRQNDVAVEDYIKNGYLKTSFINYLSLLGWHGSGDREVYTKSELVKFFSINRIQKSGAIFDIKKLNWMNNYYIKELKPHQILELYSQLYVSENKITEPMIELIYEKIERLIDIPKELKFFYNYEIESNECQEILNDTISKKIFKKILFYFKKIKTLNSQIFKNIIFDIQNELNVKGKKLWMPIRISLTGKMHGPDIGRIVEIMGKEKCIKRISKHIDV